MTLDNFLRTNNDVVIPSRESGPPASSFDRAVKTHFANGIPALALAIVSLAFYFYYCLFVSSHVDERYIEVVDRNMKSLDNLWTHVCAVGRRGENGSSLEPGVLGTLPIEVGNVTDTGAFHNSRRLLEETQICIRRLISTNVTNEEFRYQYGILNNYWADFLIAEARYLESTSEMLDAKTAVAKSFTKRQLAIDSMMETEKLKGQFADKATLWLARQSLFDRVEMPSADCDGIAERVALILSHVNDATSNHESSSSTDVFSNVNTKLLAQRLLVEVRVLQAFGCNSNASVSQRAGFCKDAVSLVDSSETMLETLGWLADAKGALHRDDAKEIATRALQKYWDCQDKSRLLPDTLAAVFRCLLTIESVKEAQVFLSERLQDISPIDQSRFRSLTAAAALRHVVSNALRENTARKEPGATNSSTKVAADSYAALSMAIQLNPESTELLSLLERFAKPKNDDELLGLLKSVLGLADSARSVPAAADAGVGSLLTAVQALGSGAIDKSTEDALAAALKFSPAHGIAASRLAVRMNAAGSVSGELAVRWLKAIIAASPDLLAAWSDRAGLHLKNGELKDALECFQYLHDKLPENEQINEALENTRAQLQKSN